MILNDPIGDLLTRMRNAQHARHNFCRAPWSRIKQEICELMKRRGLLASVAVEGKDCEREILVTFQPGRAIELKRVSTPGGRKYVGVDQLKKPLLQGHRLAILTTSLGLLTDAEAKQKNVGGELLCTLS